MKKFVCYALSSVFFVFLGYSQNSVEFGKIGPEESALKECMFDRDAEAIVIFDVGKYACFFYSTATTPLTTEFTRHIRIKILKEKGLEQADIRIPYHASGKEKIKNLTAQTYNPDGQGNWVATKVDKNLIYEKKLDNRFYEKVFAFPNVKAGSIIEYKYTVSEAGLHDWYFQKEIPVKFSSYTVDYPYDLEVFSAPVCTLPLFDTIQKDKLRTAKTFTMKDVVALREEPHTGCYKDYLQRIESNLLSYTTSRGARYNLMPGWPTIIQDLMDDPDFGGQLEKAIPMPDELDQQLKQVADPYLKMVRIHDYVKKNIAWNGRSTIWALNGVKSAWKEKSGTSGEINFILINLLQNVGLNVYPMLVSTRSHGKIYLERPGIAQFNKVMAYVRVGEKFYTLDATDQNTPANLIPLDVMSSWAMILKKIKKNNYEWGWQSLWDEEKTRKISISLKAEVLENGFLKGEAGIYNFDYARAELQPTIKDDPKKFVSEKLLKSYPGMMIDSFQVDVQNSDTLPLIQRIRFSQPIATSGEYQHFSANLFTGLEQSPFTADSRFSDVFFGVKQQYDIRASVSIPPGYQIEQIPANLSLTIADKTVSMTRTVETGNNIINVNIQIHLAKPYYSAGKYADFKAFYNKLIEIVNEQFVIRKIKA